ncbi:putative transcriptional regulator protein [Ceratocystis lukuohia]|uniref:Transcriptional regulator protein n=1 Tax=Ceratocystis lukuohia TaxID=2019550 RepID=A0ABR4M8T5_9PEZI
MSPTDQAIEDAIHNTVTSIWDKKGARDSLTVNGVRKAVEETLSLGSGFLTGDEWNRKSRNIIKELVEKLSQEDSESDEEPEEPEEPATKSNGKNKRKANADSQPSNKRTKQAKATTKSSKAPRKVASSEDESEAEISVAELSDKAEASDKNTTTPSAIHNSGNGESGDESDVSSVIDEPPTRKRTSVAKAKSKPEPKPKSAPRKLSSPQSADQQEVKKLQQQLGKCGVRKIWGVELQAYGDDDRAKIQHLKNMLRDCGMTGRFSDARAKEIKEQRELMADLHDVQAMDQTWGASEAGNGRTTRASRRAAPKSLKIQKQVIEGLSDESEGDDENGDSGEDEGMEEEKPKKKRAISKKPESDDDDDNDDYDDDRISSDAISDGDESDEASDISDDSE